MLVGVGRWGSNDPWLGIPVEWDEISGARVIVEAGHRNLVLDNFFGLSGPPRMPADIVARLNAACNEILAQPAVKQKMADLGITPSPVSQPAFAAFVKEQVAQLAPTVKAAGVRL